MTKLRKFYIALIVVVLIAFIGWRISQSYQSHSDTGAQIKIGAIFDLTADAADYGEDESKAVRLAVDEVNANGGINGKNIDLIVENAPALDIKQNISAFKKLVSVDGVVAIIGPNWDDAGTALAPLAEQYKVPVVAPDITQGAGNGLPHHYLFTLWYPQDAEADKLMSFAASRGVKRLDILRNVDTFSNRESQVAKDSAAKNNITVVHDIQAVDPQTKDFRTEILKLRVDNADAVFTVFQSPNSKCPATKQLKEQGFQGLILGESSTETAACNNILEGTFYSFPKSTVQSQGLQSRFKEKYGTDPKTPAVPNAYDATMMVVDALRVGNLSGASIQNFLKNLKNFSGAMASDISLDDQGHLKLSTEDFEIKTVQYGKFVLVE